MCISLPQIEYSPLHQYAYVAAPKSQKIEGKFYNILNINTGLCIQFKCVVQ